MDTNCKRGRGVNSLDVFQTSYLSSLKLECSILATRACTHQNAPEKESFTQGESQVRIYAPNHTVQKYLCQLMP